MAAGLSTSSSLRAYACMFGTCRDESCFSLRWTDWVVPFAVAFPFRPPAVTYDRHNQAGQMLNEILCEIYRYSVEAKLGYEAIFE